jgi:sporulation protein YunB
MDEKIFSRKRIRIPKIVKNKNEYKLKKCIKIITILVIAVLVVKVIINAVNPIIEERCKSLANTISTRICNEQATKVMANYEYDDFCKIIKDENDNIKMISVNMITINKIISDIPIYILDELNKEENNTFNIRLGSITGSKILSGIGPNIKIRMMTDGEIETDLRTEFVEAGINQTMHRIYLNIKCKISILTPYNVIKDEIDNQVLLTEGVIVGNIPDTYYNLEGLNADQILETIE